MSGYDRQSVADIVANEVIKAAPLNAEFNALRDAFVVATGHKHDGSATEGAYVPLISDPDAYNKVVIDSGNNRVQFFVEVSSAAAEQMRLQDGVLVPVVDNDIDLGTTTLEFKDLYLDGTAKIDTLTVDENATIAGTLNVTGAVTLTDNLTVNGNTVIGDAATDTVTVTADVASPLIPSADDTYDIGAVGSEWRNLYVDGTANIDSLIADTADINGGTIDGAIIGGNSAAAGSFTTIATSSTATIGSTLTVTGATTLSSTLAVTGNANFNGNTTIGDATSDTVTFTARAASDLVPSTDNARDLGSATLEWKDLYIDGTANIDSLIADTADIDAGTIDGTTIGGNSAAAITGTTITANSGFVGNLSGNVTSSGTSSFATVTTSGNVTIGGDLTVNGTTTTVSTTNTVIEDALIEIGNGTTGAPTNDSGIVIERGTEANAFIGFDESVDKFTMGTGSFTGASTGNLSITTGTLVANIEGSVTGNVTGDLTGNVTATTGTSSFATIDFDDITDGTITITGFVDEDDMVSNSATLLPTQQSVKKYVDDEILNNYNVFGLTATGAELNVLDGDTTPASVTLVGTDGFPVNDAGVTKLAQISDIATYIESTTLTNATLATPTVSGLYLSDSGFVVEGSSADANETTVTFTNPTADRTITFPDATGTVFLTDGSGNVDINGGSIDGTTIGAASAAAGSFTTVTASGDVTIADKIVHSGDTDTSIRFPAADTVTVETSGAERMRIDSSGNVGIGTSSPASALDVNGTITGGALQIDNLNVNGNTISSTNTNGNIVLDPNGTGLTVVSGDLSLQSTESIFYLYNNSATNNAHLTTNTSGQILFKTGTSTVATRLVIGNENGGASLAHYPLAGGSAVFNEDGVDADFRIESDTNTHAFFLDGANGNVGIGTSSPSARFHVASSGIAPAQFYADNYYYTAAIGNAATSGITGYAVIAKDGSGNSTDLLLINSAGSGYLTVQQAFPLIFSTNGTERARIDSSGNVGIGTSSPATTLDVNGDVTITDKIIHSGDTNTAIRFPAADTVAVETSGTERMRIDSSGNLLVGTTSAGARLDVKGAGNTSGTFSIKVANSDGTIGLQIREDGFVGSPMIYANTNANAANVVITSDGYIYRSTSSLKYKKNVQDAHFGLSELLNLRPVTYQGTSGSDTEQVFGGLIAEEVHDAGLTEFVQYADDGTPDALAYGHMVSLCIKAIQEQQAIIEALEARVAALEA